MKKFARRFTALLALLCLLFSMFTGSVLAADTGEPFPPGNLILNPDFEEGGEHWEVNSPKPGAWFNTGIYEIGDMHSGNFAALLGMVSGVWPFLFQEVEVQESSIYELSAYAMSLNGYNIPVCVDMENLDSGDSFSSELELEPYQEWVKSSIPVELEGGCRYRIIFSTEDDNPVLLDDISLVLTAPPPPQPVQLLTNGGFEGSMSGWTQRGAPNAFLTNAQSRSGSGSLYLGYFQNEGLTNYVEQSCVSGKGSYDFSVWIKTDPSLSGVGAVLFLEARDADGRVLAIASSEGSGTSTTAWKKLSVHLDAPDGTHTVAAKLGGVYCTGAFYADDAQLMYLQEA